MRTTFLEIRICRRCVKEMNREWMAIGGDKNHGIYRFKVILCPHFSGGSWLQVSLGPPKTCPYYLEHVMLQNRKRTARCVKELVYKYKKPFYVYWNDKEKEWEYASKIPTKSWLLVKGVTKVEETRTTCDVKASEEE